MRLSSFRTVILGIIIYTLIIPANEAIWPAAAAHAQTPQQQTQQAPPQQAAPTTSQGSIAVAVHNVSVDAIVTDDNGAYLKDLKKENFRILEDGKPQEIVSFGKGDSPITIVMLLEFSRMFSSFTSYTARYWGPAFLHELKPNDWIALEDFSMKTRIDVDFTHDPMEIMNGLRQMMFPDFKESNLRDAVLETIDRLKDVKGKKSILLMATGYDTFSKHTLDQTLKELKQTDVTIFSIGLGQQMYMNGLNSLPPGDRLLYGREPYVMAQNELKNYAAFTGGESFFPIFDGEIPGVFQSVAESLRSQYSLGYVPAESSLDGKYHKIKVELCAPDGGPLIVTNEKGKKVKLVVYAREGYIAPKGGVGD